MEMKWYEKLLYDLLPEGFYIRCSRVVYMRPRRIGRPDLPNGFVVSLLHLRRSKHRKALVLDYDDFLDCPLPSREAVEARAKDLMYKYSFYLPSGKLDEEAAVELLHSPYLLDYIGFDRRLALPGELAEDTMRRLLPQEQLNNIRALTEMMIGC